MIDQISNAYYSDIPLMKKLGLKHNFNAKHGEKTFVGSIQTESYIIDVWVTCYPAQLWNFHIKCLCEDYEYDVMTGSGDFSTHWPAIELLANSRIIIDMIKINGDIKYKI